MATLRLSLVTLILCCFLDSPVLAAELVLSAPPRESRAEGEKTFGPLASYLSEQLGQPVVYRQPESWAAYTLALRNGEYDFVFDGPHFASWRMVHLQHQPLVKLPGTLRFIVVTAASSKQFSQLADLRSGSLCAMASPNLATNAVLAEFGPVASPDIVVAEGGFEGIVKAYQAGSCNGMVLSESFFVKMPEQVRAELKVIYTSPGYANQTLTASPRVPAEQLSKLAAGLVSEQGTLACSALIRRYAGKRDSGLVLATADEYKGNNRLLEGVVWGW